MATTEKLKSGFSLTSGGRTEIVGNDYSAFVTIGLGIPGPTSGRMIYASHRTHDFADAGSQLISRPLLEAYYRQLCSSEKAIEPFRALRAISEAPIFLQAIPIPMTEILDAPRYAGDCHVIPGIYAHLVPVFERACADVGRTHGYAYVPQPPETREPGGLTRPEYIKDGVGFSGFSGKTKTNDYGHGNAEYGVLVVRNLIREFEKAGLRATEPA